MISNGTITLDQLVAQVKGNFISDMGGEKVMLSISNGKYYNLGQTGGVIWDYIQEPIIIRALVERLISVYQIEQSECEEQVLSFLDSLKKEGLIEVSDL